jgi:hypothetical protein
MQRLLIAAVSAAFLATAAAPVLADDYPPCTTPTQDHCRVVSHKASSKHHHHAAPAAKAAPKS